MTSSLITEGVELDAFKGEIEALKRFRRDNGTGLRNEKDQKDAVIELQKFLNSLGLDTGGIDGKYGKNTNSSVIEFQKAVGLSTDGDAGKFTIGKIMDLVNDLDAIRKIVNSLKESIIGLNYKSSISILLEKDLSNAELEELKDFKNKWNDLFKRFPEFEAQLMADISKGIETDGKSFKSDEKPADEKPADGKSAEEIAAAASAAINRAEAGEVLKGTDSYTRGGENFTWDWEYSPQQKTIKFTKPSDGSVGNYTNARIDDNGGLYITGNDGKEIRLYTGFVNLIRAVKGQTQSPPVAPVEKPEEEKPEEEKPEESSSSDTIGGKVYFWKIEDDKIFIRRGNDKTWEVFHTLIEPRTNGYVDDQGVVVKSWRYDETASAADLTLFGNDKYSELNKLLISTYNLKPKETSQTGTEPRWTTPLNGTPWPEKYSKTGNFVNGQDKDGNKTYRWQLDVAKKDLLIQEFDGTKLTDLEKYVEVAVGTESNSLFAKRFDDLDTYQEFFNSSHPNLNAAARQHMTTQPPVQDNTPPNNGAVGTGPYKNTSVSVSPGGVFGLNFEAGVNLVITPKEPLNSLAVPYRLKIKNKLGRWVAQPVLKDGQIGQEVPLTNAQFFQTFWDKWLRDNGYMPNGVKTESIDLQRLKELIEKVSK